MTKGSDSTNSSGGKVMPSQFMRQLRPECYSDTGDRTAYLLDAPLLEYHLDSITSRNQTQNFEIFCRKLCERTICPNLRTHTGPDGGGDSKVDTETFPVAEPISTLFYIGDQKSANERWAFAFSAKKDWKSKVKADVQKIGETGRNYKKIFFVTNMFARDKDRADMEDLLSKEYGIPVIIHDRSWIIKEIIENNRKDIAYNYLNVGEAKTDPFRLGPEDYSRKQQLLEIEKSIDDPEAFKGMERQRVTEALLAAKLSRNMENLRIETDGRFARAVRLAESDGTYRQKLEAKYEKIWTAFWWFDDLSFLNDSYESFEADALKSDHALNLEFLCNLLQLLFNSTIYGLMSREECRLDERISRLSNALEQIASYKDRPNNSLQAQTSLLIIRMNQVILHKEFDELADVWKAFSTIIANAKGLGEFNADRLVQVVEIAGNIAGNDRAYNNLVEKTAEFVQNREGEAKGALILLNRANKLGFEDSYEMIRLLGKAAIGLAKKEYLDHLVEALKLLMLAYRSTGLLWAARATCTFLAASLVMEGEEDSQLSSSFIPTMKSWAWVALELFHLPDFLFSIQLLNGALATFPLTDESKSKVAEDIRELDAALGSLLLNLSEADLRKLEGLPYILESLGLFVARSALLYIMGYANVLRADGSLPECESDEDADRIFSLLASQPVAKSVVAPPILNSDHSQAFSTSILGMIVSINTNGDTNSILIAETLLGTLEAFFATTIEHRISPHTEKLRINLIQDSEILKYTFEINNLDMIGTLVWPEKLSVNDFTQQKDINKFWAQVACEVLIACCVLHDKKSLLTMLDDDAIQHRIAMVANAPISYQRVASRGISRISDWQTNESREYSICAQRPTLLPVQQHNDDALKIQSKIWINGRPPVVKDHRKYEIQSVIDVHAWDKARWKGTAYAQLSPTCPPCMAFMFENEDGGRKIFERWVERFGTQDKQNEVNISIIRRLPNQNKHHYCVQISSKLPVRDDFDADQLITMATRSMTMTPNNDINLENFLKSYHRFGAFYLLPAFLKDMGMPKMVFELAILKSNLSVKLAQDINESDIENVALLIRK